MTKPLIVSNISITLGQTEIIKKINFSLEQGEIGCLLGPSGCGKTTLLRTIAGFQQPSDGEIRLHGQTVANRGIMLTPELRNIGMVFQDLALFPHLTVAGNIAFGMRGASKSTIEQRVEELLTLVNLTDLRDTFPHKLSGGQQQRIALVRAMAPRPSLLLLDEPFSSQDTERRVQLAHEVREILSMDNTTAILVTHDQQEAFAIADKIGVISGGTLHQWDKPYNLYHRPADQFVAKFIGEGVFINAQIIDNTALECDLGVIKGELTGYQQGANVNLLIRPDDVIHDDSSPYTGELTATIFRGSDYLYKIKMPSNTHLLCLAPSHHHHEVGEHIGIRLEPDHLVTFLN